MSHSHATPRTVPCASFVRRLAAQVIDVVWLVPLTFGLALVGTLVNGGEDLSLGGEVMLNVVCGLVVLLFWASRQATPGKLVVGIRIVDAATGGPVPAGRLVARYLGYIVSSIPLGLGYLWMLWDPRSQTWHDKLGGTLVVLDPRFAGPPGR